MINHWFWDSNESIRLAHSAPLAIHEIANIYDVLIDDIEHSCTVQYSIIKVPIDFKLFRHVFC